MSRPSCFWVSDVSDAVDEVMIEAVKRDNPVEFAHAVGRELLAVTAVVPVLAETDCPDCGEMSHEGTNVI